MATRAAKLALRGKALSDTGTEIGIVNNADATAITIDSSEKVGINNSSPTQRLEINGNAQFNMYDSGSGAGGYYTAKGMQIGNAFDAGLSGGNDDRNAIVWNERGTDLLFGTNNLERLRIDYAGNVGIGVTPESSHSNYTALQVGGTGSISSSTTAAAGADTHYGQNMYLATSGDWKYQVTDEASLMSQNDGQFRFRVAPSGTADAAISFTTAAKIKNNGAFQASKDGSYSSWGGNVDGHQFVLSDNYVALTAHSELSTMTAGVMRCLSNRGPSSAYNMLTTTTGSLTDDQHRLRADGNAYADGSWNGGGADYAEYFEWTDGNSSNADRRGVSVVLVGNKIRPAVDGESPIGVISGNPSVVGDAAWSKWDSKYLTDDFNTHVLESYTITEWEAQEVNDDGDTITVKKSFETDKIPASEIAPVDATIISVDDDGNTLTRRQLNSAWNPDTEYVPREDRQEWDTVGLMGKLRVIKGQPVDSRWIKMRDVSDTVEEWLVR